jgi:hypothetical protein
MIIIPLGIRCDAKGALNIIKLSGPDMPFDWCQMSCSSMCEVISLQEDAVSEFWEKYFKNLNKENVNLQTGSWFPHDLHKNPNGNESMEECIEKYSRRTLRMLYNLKIKDNKIIFTIFQRPSKSSKKWANKIYESLMKFENFTFITINAEEHNNHNKNRSNILVPLDDWKKPEHGDFGDWDVGIGEALLKYAKENNIMLKPTVFYPSENKKQNGE